MVTCLMMTTLIEDPTKLEYLTSDSLWTKTPAAGKDYGTVAVAMAIGRKEPIGRFNIVGYFHGTKQLINIDHGRGKGIAEPVVV